MIAKKNHGVVLITGASAGIGRALAFEFAPRAKKLVLVARRLDRLETLRGQLSQQYPGLDVIALAADLADERDIEALLARVSERVGQVDVLVNNAGVGHSVLFDRSDWKRTRSGAAHEHSGSGAIDLGARAFHGEAEPGRVAQHRLWCGSHRPTQWGGLRRQQALRGRVQRSAAGRSRRDRCDRDAGLSRPSGQRVRSGGWVRRRHGGWSPAISSYRCRAVRARSGGLIRTRRDSGVPWPGLPFCHEDPSLRTIAGATETGCQCSGPTASRIENQVEGSTLSEQTQAIIRNESGFGSFR
jgi:hypothetical protein